MPEVANALNKKIKHQWSDVLKILDDMKNNNSVYSNTQLTILQTCKIATDYKFSFYDSLIISSAIECNCTILFSEDMQQNQLIENKHKIVNPFKI